MSHHCHARGCKASCPPEYLMCPRHWRMVPRKLQRAVWLTYRPGQCDDKEPSDAWHKAADAAILAVARKERGLCPDCGQSFDNITPTCGCSRKAGEKANRLRQVKPF